MADDVLVTLQVKKTSREMLREIAEADHGSSMTREFDVIIEREYRRVFTPAEKEKAQP